MKKNARIFVETRVDRKTEYLKDKIYLPVYGRVDTTESRLLISAEDDFFLFSRKNKMKVYVPVSDANNFLSSFKSSYYEDDTDEDSTYLTYKVFRFPPNLAITKQDFENYVRHEIVAKHDPQSCDKFWLQIKTKPMKNIFFLRNIDFNTPINFVSNEWEEIITSINYPIKCNYVIAKEEGKNLYLTFVYLGAEYPNHLNINDIIHTKDKVYIVKMCSNAELHNFWYCGDGLKFRKYKQTFTLEVYDMDIFYDPEGIGAQLLMIHNADKFNEASFINLCKKCGQYNENMSIAELQEKMTSYVLA